MGSVLQLISVIKCLTPLDLLLLLLIDPIQAVGIIVYRTFYVSEFPY